MNVYNLKTNFFVDTAVAGTVCQQFAAAGHALTALPGVRVETLFATHVDAACVEKLLAGCGVTASIFPAGPEVTGTLELP